MYLFRENTHRQSHSRRPGGRPVRGCSAKIARDRPARAGPSPPRCSRGYLRLRPVVGPPIYRPGRLGRTNENADHSDEAEDGERGGGTENARKRRNEMSTPQEVSRDDIIALIKILNRTLSRVKQTGRAVDKMVRRPTSMTGHDAPDLDRHRGLTADIRKLDDLLEKMGEKPVNPRGHWVD